MSDDAQYWPVTIVQYPSIFLLHQDVICSSAFSSHPAFPHHSLLTRPPWASRLTRPYLSSSPIPGAASAPSRTSARAFRSSGSHTHHIVPMANHGGTTWLPPPHISPCWNHLTTPESLPRVAHSPAGCVGSHRLPRFTLPRSLSMSRAHPQPLLGSRSIPATSAFYEPV